MSAVPVSTAGVNIGAGLMMVFAVLSPEVWRATGKTLTSRTSLAAVTLFATLALSMAYTSAGHEEAFNFLLKYRKLLLLPVLFWVFQGSERHRWCRAALWALFATLTLTMVLTYTNFLGWTAVGPMHGDTPVTRPWVFKDHISGGLMMAFLVYLSIALAADATGRVAPWLLRIVAALALINVLFVLQGRTGQIVAVAYMAVYVVMQLRKFRQLRERTGRLIVLASVALCAGLAVYAVTERNSRIAEIGKEITQFEVYNQDTSVGVRLEFYQRSVELMRHRPVAGYGVGSIQPEFERLARASTGGRAAMAGNPHNEFFLMGVQLGLIGVVLFVWLLTAIAQDGRRLDRLARTVVHGFLFAFVLACCANSSLVNFTEGNLFVFLTGILLSAGRRHQD